MSCRDFYTAIYKRSKAKFDQFVAAGSVLTQYANILEMLLRLRQACDHPCLTLKKQAKERAGQSAAAVRSTSGDAVFADIGELIAKFMSADSGAGITAA